MPHSAKAAMPRLVAPFAPLNATWRAGLLRLALVWGVLFLLFLPDWAAMARQWWDSSTYNHILLLPAILGWLVWQRGREVLRISPASWWPALVPAGGAAFFWLLGAFSGLDLARQLGAVALMVLAVPLLLGPRVAIALLFPLCYAMLLVPFGDELIVPLQMITAAITIALVDLSGIPAAIDGVFIDTPAGLFEVAEACSGVKFLIAMVAYGLLVANVCFVSWTRRAVFLFACVVVPILANGVRAWATIFAAQFVGVEAAAGFDHIVYGWIFFAVVMVLVTAGAWRFFDRPGGAPAIRAEAVAAVPIPAWLGPRALGGKAAAALLLALAGGAHVWAGAAGTMAAELPEQLVFPEARGWQVAEYASAWPWEPRANGAARRGLVSYADAQGRRVEMFVALYPKQGEGSGPGSFGEGALPPESGWSWLSSGPPEAGARSERLLAPGPVERLAYTWYRSDELVTGSVVRLKLAAMADKLLLRPRLVEMVILSAEERPGQPASQTIAEFRAALGAPADDAHTAIDHGAMDHSGGMD